MNRNYDILVWALIAFLAMIIIAVSIYSGAYWYALLLLGIIAVGMILSKRG